ncbi:GNAT family N-acetyltransferase [Shewanella dokdonensis]|uniref:GNAT family N-acetyltransferase n=1 Tax=Shewanella dokdonensis TaxID=712036 RepID=A0ABX8DGE4_9GAMM|nr:GNAT family N-acetyltransferase [Shewanella dokdonensis]MCL1075011.1 GNAT family N-acetyltransferase [Shewanella dokdonensis]QVK23435.1 GNAT family N-acetyltransferase [Shewanella dokdonensis]
MILATSDRLILRHFQDDDLGALFEMNRDPQILTYIPSTPFQHLHEAEQVLKQVIYADYERYGYGRWAVELKASGKVIGFCGPKYLADFDKVELGYRYFPQYWGQGIGFEAASAALPLFKTQCGVDEVIALIMPGNQASAALAHKLGMQVYAHGQYLGHEVDIFHTWL